MDVYADCGSTLTEKDAVYSTYFIQNCYAANEFVLNMYDVRTDKPTNTPTRAPTSTQCHAWSENLMEQLATELGVDPLEFRIDNFLQPGDTLFFDGGEVYEGPNPLPDMLDT